MEALERLEAEHRRVVLILDEAEGEESRAEAERCVEAVERRIAAHQRAAERKRAAGQAREEREEQEQEAVREREQGRLEAWAGELATRYVAQLAQVQSAVDALEPLVREAVQVGDELRDAHAQLEPDQTRRAVVGRSRTRERIADYLGYRLATVLPNLPHPTSRAARPITRG